MKCRLHISRDYGPFLYPKLMENTGCPGTVNPGVGKVIYTKVTAPGGTALRTILVRLVLSSAALPACIGLFPGCVLFDRFATYETELEIRSQLSVPADIGAMVSVPGGSFDMGWPTSAENEIQVGVIRVSEEELALSRPVHREFVPPFAIGKYEVTALEYSQFLGELSPHENPADFVVVDTKTMRTTIEKRADKFVPREGFEFDPATCVTYAGARRYCEWLSKRDGETYRLPTEIEWEWLAQALDPIARSDSTQLHAVDPWMRSRYMPLASYRTSPGVIPVGNHPESLTPEGVSDILGNAMEWCGNYFYEYTDADQIRSPEALHGLATPPYSTGANDGSYEKAVCRGYVYSEGNPKHPSPSATWIRVLRKSRGEDRREIRYNTGFRVLRELP